VEHLATTVRDAIERQEKLRIVERGSWFVLPR